MGRARRTQSDWLMEARTTLQPLLEAKHHAHMRVLQVNSIANRSEFWKTQKIVKHTVDCAKERWILHIPREAEVAKKDGRQCWTYGSFRWAM